MPTRPQPVEIQQRSFSPVNSALLHQQVVQVAMPLTSQMHLFIDYFFLPQTILALGFLCSPGLFPPRRHLIFKTPHELLDDYEIIPSAKFIFFSLYWKFSSLIFLCYHKFSMFLSPLFFFPFLIIALWECQIWNLFRIFDPFLSFIAYKKLLSSINLLKKKFVSIPFFVSPPLFTQFRLLFCGPETLLCA